MQLYLHRLDFQGPTDPYILAGPAVSLPSTTGWGLGPLLSKWVGRVVQKYLILENDLKPMICIISGKVRKKIQVNLISLVENWLRMPDSLQKELAQSDYRALRKRPKRVI